MKAKKIDTSKFITFHELRRKWMKDPEFVREWEKLEPH